VEHLLFLLKVLTLEAQKRHFLLKSAFFGASYLAISIIFINYKSFWSFLASDYEILSKVRVLSLIFFGSFQALSAGDIILLSITAILFGLNIELVLRKMKFLASLGSLHIAFGTGLISLAATGCASCGLSIASIVGLSAALASLPFHGIELYFLSIMTLFASLFFNLNTLVKACNIKKF